MNLFRQNRPRVTSRTSARLISCFHASRPDGFFFFFSEEFARRLAQQIHFPVIARFPTPHPATACSCFLPT